MATSKKFLKKKLKKINIVEQEADQHDHTNIMDIIDTRILDSDQPGNAKPSSKESIENGLQQHMNFEFQKDLDKSVSESFLDQVSFGKSDDETEGEIEFVQSPDSDHDSERKRLYFGRASYRNIYNDPKRQEERNWITWETFSAISGMAVPELVRRAEVADLVLDDRGLARIRKRFTSMSKMHKRQFYKCGDRYVIPEQIPTWSEECKKSNIKTNDVGDDSLNRKVALMHGDITTLEVDAVVNSINSFVTDSFEGVTKAITNAGSSLLYYELESIKFIFDGHVKATAGYLLPAKYIFHTAGPSKHGSIADTLKNCYINCLNKMVVMGLRTLAFCCIATGVKKVNIRHAANIALTTVKTWLQENKDSVDKIIFCVYDIDNWVCYQEFMPKIFPPSDDNDTTEASLLPIEILRMDKNSIELYKRALSEGKEAVHNIRVMVVGHYGVGKTTLTKRLFDEEVKISERESTNGIDVHVRRCKVSLETGEWTVSDKDQKIESASHRLVKLLKQPTFITDTNVVEKQKDDLDAKEEGLDCVDGHVSMEDKDALTDHTSKETSDIGSTGEDIGVSIPLQDEYIDNKASAEKPKEENILYHLKDLIDSLKQRSAADTDVDMADVSIWDFAGQYAFYATHQVFLSRRAVYLLVTDISKHVEDVVKDDDCFLDSKGVKHWKISEFVNFWLNSIHEFCSSPYADGPPVVLVGTFADKLNQESRQETVDDFFYTLRSSLLDKATSSHLTDDDFVVDNSIKDENIKLLKQRIVKVAQSQPNWGELVPAKWITLENIIVKLKDDGLKVLHKDKLCDLNNTLPVSIETEDELDLFLKFHHESGNILYYSDNMLSENIVLDPQWLIDAFKSLITAKMFCCRKPKIFKKWVQFDQSAILTRELVDAIWGQEENSVFQEHQELLLEYLAKLGFISKPHKQPEETGEINYYFAPCVLKTSPPEEVFVYSDYTNRRSTSVLCFTTTSGFLPTAVFNKLLASCIAKWPIAKSNKRNLIFCGCGVFDLIDNHKLYLYFFDHNINIWVTKLSTTNVEPDKYLCLKIYNFISDFLGTEIRLSSGFEVFLRCSHSDLHNNDNLFKVEDIASKQEVVCSSEPEAHVHRTDELTKYWLYSESDLQPNVLTEKELNRMAYYIGKEYQSLGIELGLTNAEIDHICLDFKTTVDRIRNILLKWKKQNRGNATVEVLSAAMKMVGIDAGTVIEKAKGHS